MATSVWHTSALCSLAANILRMAVPSYQDFQTTDVTLSRFAKALGHPARLAILKVLAERKECICGEIVDIVPLAQSTVSQHLRELKKAGLIKGRIFGPKSCYCINWEGMNAFLEMFESFRSEIKASELGDDCC